MVARKCLGRMGVVFVIICVCGGVIVTTIYFIVCNITV